MLFGKLVLALVALSGPDGQTIFVNPEEIISIRAPRDSQTKHFGTGIHCVLQTVDGKLINVADECDQVRNKLGAKS